MIAVQLKKAFKEKVLFIFEINKTKENIHNIYNWQYINSIRLWVNCVSYFPSDNELGQLMFPILQICDGMINLYSTEKFFPLFLIVIQMMNQLGHKCQHLIPDFKYLLHILRCSKFQKKKEKGAPKHFDFQINVKANKKILSTNGFWNQMFVKVLNLLTESIALYSDKIFFPELSYNLVYQLKQIQKSYKFNFYKSKIQNLIKIIQQTYQNILLERAGMNLVPKDQKELAFASKNNLQIEAEQIFIENDEFIRNQIQTNRDADSEFDDDDEEEKPKNKKQKRSKKVKQDGDDENEGENLSDRIIDESSDKDQELSGSAFSDLSEGTLQEQVGTNDQDDNSYESLEGEDVDRENLMEGEEFLSELDEDDQ